MVVQPPLVSKDEINRIQGNTDVENKVGFMNNIMDNPIFSAGVGVAGIGVGLTLLRRGVLSSIQLAQRYFTISLEIPSRDKSYNWVQQWINTTKKDTQHLGVETRVISHDNGTQSVEFDFIPSPGRHYMWFKRNQIIVEREREKTMVDQTNGIPWETVKLTLLGRNSKVFEDLLKETRVLAASKQEGKIQLYMPMMVDWRPFGRPRKKRPINSVILDQDLNERILKDVKEFLSTGSWYTQRGVPHRRGYLQYGPPGSGKTSYIQALAGELDYSICILNLNDRGLTDDRLIHLMTEVPPHSFIQLEDIDAVFNKRENTYNVTFSGLLNALDGVTSIEERIIFMTTNHIERLDHAQIRPGRIDMKIYLGNSTKQQQRAIFKQFFCNIDTIDIQMYALKNQSKHVLNIIQNIEKLKGSKFSLKTPYQDAILDILADEFVNILNDITISMAELQGLLMSYKDQPFDLLQATEELAKLKRLKNDHDLISKEIDKNHQVYLQENNLL